MIDTILNLLNNMETRQQFYVLEIVMLTISCFSIFFAGKLISGTGKCLGKTYGKTNYAIATIKYIFMAIGFICFFLLIILWLVDFIKNFTHISLWYFLLSVIGGIIYFVIFFKGQSAGIDAEKRLIEKCQAEIDKIMLGNPIVQEVIKKVNFDSTIKTIHIYQDGIAFYKDKKRYPCIETEEIKYGASYSSDAEKLIKKLSDEWLSVYGTVVKSGSNDYILYADFLFDKSETAMHDISLFLHRYLNRDFTRGNTFQKSWVYDEYITSGGGVVAKGDKVYTTPYDTKHIYASLTTTAFEAIYETTDEEKTEENKKPVILAKW